MVPALKPRQGPKGTTVLLLLLSRSDSSPLDTALSHLFLIVMPVAVGHGAVEGPGAADRHAEALITPAQAAATGRKVRVFAQG